MDGRVEGAREGSIEGVDVGDEEGAWLTVGTLDGRVEGAREGCIDGVDVGDDEGARLGSMVGLIEMLGDIVGPLLSLGNPVGRLLGPSDGIIETLGCKLCNLEGKAVGKKLGCSLAVLDGRALPVRLGRAVGFWLVGCVEVDGMSDEYDVGRDVGKILLVGLTVGLLEDDGAPLGCPLLNRVGVLVGLLDVLGSIDWRTDCSSDGLFDGTTEGKLLSFALGTDECDTLGILDGSMDAVGSEVGF